MHMASSNVDSLSVSIPCMIRVPHQDWHVAGTVWGLSQHHLHLECPAKVSPGMTLALSLVVPGTDQAIRVDEALVTWTRGSEFGVRFSLTNIDRIQ
jgi:hypothetical protein